MSSIALRATTFVLVFGGAVLGLLIRRRLPEHHQNADTKDVVRLGMGLVGTIVAIALGLLVGSAYSYFNNQTDELVHISADVGGEQTSTTVFRPLLFVMIFCLTAIFVSWGLFSPLNTTTVTTFFVAALCVSGAILLILELYSPYTGLLRISSTPLRLAYESLRP